MAALFTKKFFKDDSSCCVWVKVYWHDLGDLCGLYLKKFKKIPCNFTIFWSSCDLFTSNRARYCWAISRGVILPLFQPPISSLAYSTTWQFGFYHRTSPRTAPFCKVRNGIFIILIFIISRIIFFLFEINKYLF